MPYQATKLPDCKPGSSLQGPSYQMPDMGEIPFDSHGLFDQLFHASIILLMFSCKSPITFLNKLGAVLNIDRHSSFSHTQTHFPSHHSNLKSFSYPVLGSIIFVLSHCCSENDSFELNLCYKIFAVYLRLSLLLPMLCFPKFCFLAVALCSISLCALTELLL